MLPHAPRFNLPHQVHRHAMLGSYNCITSGVISNFDGLQFVEFAVAIGRANMAYLTTLVISVVRIVCMCTKRHMRNIDAARNIASVQNYYSDRDFTNTQRPFQTMRAPCASSISEGAIAGRIGSAHPYLTAALGYSFASIFKVFGIICRWFIKHDTSSKAVRCLAGKLRTGAAAIAIACPGK